MTDSEGRSYRTLGGGLAVLAVGPLLLSEYLLGIVLLGMIYAVFALSLDLVWGHSGVLTFGHAVFFGVGAYVAGLAVSTSVFLGIAAAVVVPAGLAIGIAGPLFRREIGAEYFAIITLAIAVVANRIARSWDSVTGGANGLGVAPPRLLGTTLVLSDITIYYLALAGLVGTVALTARVVDSPVGAALGGIDSNERKARSLGYDPAVYRTVAFGVAGGVAGFGGALYAVHSGFVAPPVVGFELSTMALVWVLVGGRGTLVGPVVGAVGITLFENLVSGVFVHVWTLVLGLTLVVVVLGFPGGLVRAAGTLRGRWTTVGGHDD